MPRATLCHDAASAVRAGDDRAFDELARRYRPGVCALCFDRTRDFDVAEDLTQEALLKAHAAWGSLRDPEAFPQWLRQIALNCCRSWVRRLMPAHADLASAERLPGLGTFEEVTRRQLAREIASALAQLPENNRLAFLMHVQGCRYREIAEFLGVAETTIVGRLHRARGRLRSLLEERRILEYLQHLGDQYLGGECP
ncbi:MAG: RNA polymerase sigma factor [Armatimonadetes bacterium]|nr:RNA polymerase sigma factor [Armatimonadota bacterium]